MTVTCTSQMQGTLQIAIRKYQWINKLWYSHTAKYDGTMKHRLQIIRNIKIANYSILMKFKNWQGFLGDRNHNNGHLHGVRFFGRC